jgi:hypothetical protein
VKDSTTLDRGSDVDEVREEHGCKRVFDDCTQEESFAADIIERSKRCKVKGRGLFQFCNFDGWKK